MADAGCHLKVAVLLLHLIEVIFEDDVISGLISVNKRHLQEQSLTCWCICRKHLVH